jgi:hypothetical protein
MPELVLLTGVLIVGISLFLIIRTEALPGLLERVFGSGWLYGAALLRFLLGAALIGSADSVAYSAAVQLFGWLFCVAGLALVVFPRQLIRRTTAWFSGLSALPARLWLTASLLLGLFFLAAYFA